MSFKDLKKNSGNIQTLSQQLDKLNNGKSYDDDRVWSVERDKSGNGFAICRFLPAPPNEDVPFVQVFSHSFKNNGVWYIENCPTTLGHKCCVCESNTALWNSGIDSDKKIASDRKRKLRYYSNVYVIKDPLHPEFEGKVMLFNYGKKIFDKITASSKPIYPGEVPINPFDFWTGRDFKIKIKTVGDFPNYDDCAFDPSSAFMGGDDAKLEALWKTEYSLQEFINPSKFKTYDELAARFSTVMSSAGPQGAGRRTAESVAASAPRTTAPKTNVAAKPVEEAEGEDQMAYLSKLMNES